VRRRFEIMAVADERHFGHSISRREIQVGGEP
jgi:hypothetical protein